MVNNKKTIGQEINKKTRRELIYLYKTYIEDSNNSDNYFTNNAIKFDKSHDLMHTLIVNKALNLTWNMQEKIPIHKKLSKKEAKKILKELEKEEKRENKIKY